MVISSIRTALLTTDGTTVGEVTTLVVTEGDLRRAGDEGVTDPEAEVVDEEASSREEGGLELGLGRGSRVSAKVTGGPTVSSLGLPRPRITLVGEFSLLALGKLTATLKYPVDPGASVGLLSRGDLKVEQRFSGISLPVGLSSDPSVNIGGDFSIKRSVRPCIIFCFCSFHC